MPVDRSARSSPVSLETLPRAEADGYVGLADLGAELAQESSRAGAGLHRNVAAAVGDLVRMMNCYYSNLLEGSNTHPLSIERAMQAKYEGTRKERNLQHEARAHVEVQQLIDRGELDGLGLGSEFVRRIHREFFRRMPEDMRFVTEDATGEKIEILAGEFRTRDVLIGDREIGHIPIEWSLVPAFMQRFEEGYGEKRVTASTAAIAAAASHHRLAWVHPFLDGNGRVSRLYSHAYLRRWRLGSELWSVSRGLARSVEDYKRKLKDADARPQTMNDGRGSLSESRLIAWCRYFLETALDQARFMAGLLDPAGLAGRFQVFLENEQRRRPAPAATIDRRTIRVIDHALLHGEVPKATVRDLLGVDDRQARRLMLPLESRGLFHANGRHAPYRMAFPVAECEILFPRLFAPGEIVLGADRREPQAGNERQEPEARSRP